MVMAMTPMSLSLSSTSVSMVMAMSSISAMVTAMKKNPPVTNAELKAMAAEKKAEQSAKKALGDMKILRNRLGIFQEIKRWPKVTQDRSNHMGKHM